MVPALIFWGGVVKILDLKVFPRAKKNAFQEKDGQIKIYLTAPAVDGSANKALIKFLAEHYNVRKYHVKIIKGLKSRQKTARIETL